MIDITELKECIRDYYAEKDSMHSLDHVDRLYERATSLSSGKAVDFDVLLLGAYFHGILKGHENLLFEFTKKLNIENDIILRTIRAVQESYPESKPESLEGTILHDAHLIEGCKEFMVTKSLLTGSERGQTIQETIAYMKENILGKRTCVLPEAQAIYEEMEDYSRKFIENLESVVCKS
jgi:uncharacterized protein